MSKKDSERAVAAKRWRWMPGMLCGWAWGCASLPWAPGSPVVPLKPTRITFVSDSGDPWGNIVRPDGLGGFGSLATRGHVPLPDLDDPATLGAVVLGLLPDLWSDPYFSIIADIDGRWRCTGSKDYPGLYGYDSKVACAVAALEAVP